MLRVQCRSEHAQALAVCESWFRGFKILVAVQKNASEE